MNETTRDTHVSEKPGASDDELRRVGVTETQTTEPSGEHDFGAESRTSSERVKEHARAQARQAKEQASEQARRLAQEARERGRRLVEEQQHNAATQVGDFATALHSSARERGRSRATGV